MHDPTLLPGEAPRQAILNAHPVPPKREQVRGWIPVRARIEWGHDGVEWVDTVAFTWTSRLVLVQLADRRYRLRGVWVAPADVTRSATDEGRSVR